MIDQSAASNTSELRAQAHRRIHGALPADERDTNAINPAIAKGLDPESPLHVVYLAGAGRSGSTLLADLLGATPGMAHAGELRYVWQRGFIENRLCACTEHFTDCGFWTDVRADIEASGLEKPLRPAQMVKRIQASTRIRRLGSLMRSSKVNDTAAADQIAALYESVQRHSGSAVIIDSSKLPSYCLLLDRDPRFKVSVVHLVRDPRGVVFSWGRVKATPDSPSKKMQQMSTKKASLLWLLWNSLTLTWWRKSSNYVCVRYEDFLAEPAATASSILDHLGYGPASFEISEEGIAQLGANFGIAGNPDRFRRSSRPLRLDDRWKEDLDPWKRRLTTAIAAPLLSHFRYPLRTAN